MNQYLTDSQMDELERRFGAHKIKSEPIDRLSAFFGAAAIVLAVAGLWL